MVAAFAGVAGDPSGNNDIIVRGNSPKGILWRLEGIEIPNPNHPYGVRGVSMHSLVPPLAAIGNAVSNAVGVRMTHVPMSPPRILKAIEDGQA